MRNPACSTILLPLLSACGPAPSSAGVAQEVQPPTNGAFIHLSHGTDDPHRSLMALSMANRMAGKRKPRAADSAGHPARQKVCSAAGPDERIVFEEGLSIPLP